MLRMWREIGEDVFYICAFCLSKVAVCCSFRKAQLSLYTLKHEASTSRDLSTLQITVLGVRNAGS